MAGTPSTSTIDHIVLLSPPGTLGETRKKFVEYGFEGERELDNRFPIEMAFLSKTLAALHLVVYTPAVSLKTCSLYVVQGGLWENGHIAVKLTIRNSSGYTRWDVSGTNRIHSSS